MPGELVVFYRNSAPFSIHKLISAHAYPSAQMTCEGNDIGTIPFGRLATELELPIERVAVLSPAA